jgi:TonB family protein
LASIKRRRRTNSLAQWRLTGIGIIAVGAHALLFSFTTTRMHSLGDSQVLSSSGSVAGVGGIFEVSASCMTEVVGAALGQLLRCQVPWTNRDACVADTMARYRVGAVDCSRPDPVQIAEYDETELLDADGLELATLAPEQLETLEPPEEELRRPEGQVVDIPQIAPEEKPADAKYVAEFDARAEKELVKRGTPGDSMMPPSPPAEERNAEPSPPTPESSSAQQGSGALSMRSPGAGTRVDQPEPNQRVGSALGFETMAESGVGLVRGTETRRTAPQDEPGAAGGSGSPGSRAPNIRPSEELLRRATGGTNDYLPDVDEGEYTALNTRKWKYATFFNRVKRQVAQNWHPEQAYRLRDPNGNVYGTKDRMTVLTVSLKPDGTLANMIITFPSGVEFLDDEAMKAFRLAQPFPNPPGGLVDAESNLITFRFGFSFEINSRTPWKVFRYQN